MRKLTVPLLTSVALGCPGIGIGQETTVPNTFEAGTPARASEVNDNFSALVDAINANSAAIADGGLEVHEVPGRHYEMYDEPNVQVLAEKLGSCLRDARAAQSN